MLNAINSILFRSAHCQCLNPLLSFIYAPISVLINIIIVLLRPHLYALQCLPESLGNFNISDILVGKYYNGRNKFKHLLI